MFLICFYNKPDGDECGTELVREIFSPSFDSSLVPVDSWDQVEGAAEDYVEKNHGDLDWPVGELDCWIWESGRVNEARRVVVNIETAISVTADLKP